MIDDLEGVMEAIRKSLETSPLAPLLSGEGFGGGGERGVPKRVPVEAGKKAFPLLEIHFRNRSGSRFDWSRGPPLEIISRSC
jgi:hypothetical protein